MGLWGVTVLGLLVGYRPPKRHTKYDHLSITQKIGKLDLPGMFLVRGVPSTRPPRSTLTSSSQLALRSS